MAGPNIYLHVDISDAMHKINALRAVHTKAEMDKLLYRVFDRTGKTVRTILRRQIPQDYEVTSGYVASTVGSPQLGGGANISCTIPITDTKGGIGSRYSARGGAHGWNAVKRKRYKITAKVVRGQTSTLPSVMKGQGGNPPFRNLGSSLGGAAYTRTGKARLPIVRVVGLAVPQMPLNRSKADVQSDIMNTLMKRLEHEHDYLIGRCR